MQRLAWGIVAAYTVVIPSYLLLRGLFGGDFWWLALLNTFAPYFFLPLIITLPLALLARMPRFAALQTIPLVIVLFWFIPPLLPSPAPPPTDREALRVVLFNMMGAWNDMVTAQPWLVQQDADIIVLVETESPFFDPRLPELYVMYPYEEEIRGNIRVFSRLPFNEIEPIWLEEVTDALPGRLMLRLDIQWDEQPFSLYAVHLSLPEREPQQSGDTVYAVGFPFSFMLEYDETRRNKQIERLLEIVANEPQPYLVLGDFNTSSYSVIYDRMVAVMQDSYQELGYGTGHTYPVGGVHPFPAWVQPMIRIDYIWHSQHWRTVHFEVGPALNSDHLPLVAELVLQDAPQRVRRR